MNPLKSRSPALRRSTRKGTMSDRRIREIAGSETLRERKVRDVSFYLT